MKKFALFFVSFWVAVSAHAECDGYLKIEQTDARRASLYKRDCDIQSRYSSVQRFFSQIGINVADLAEYRSIRFIDRSTLNTAMVHQIHPTQIYRPAPATWEVWDSGIRQLFGNDQMPYLLFKSRGFNTNTPGMEKINFATINTVLLKNESNNISRDYLANKANRTSTPGTYRQAGDSAVGFTTSYDPNYQGKIDRSQNSMRRTQHQWEIEYGASFSTVVKHNGGLNPDQATFGVSMIALERADKSSMFVTYAPSDLVPTQISWIQSFVSASMDRYRVGKPLMPPIEFSAMVQKWFVTVHPFSDGNGRTSRAVQDFILATFKMPYAPGGDLQNDSLEEYDVYVDHTYEKMEALVAKLEACVDEYRQNKKISYGCKTIDKIEMKAWRQ